MRDRASAMYLLNSSITSVGDERFCGGLASCAATHRGATLPTRIVPAPRNRVRRVSMDALYFTSTPSWRGLVGVSVSSVSSRIHWHPVATRLAHKERAVIDFGKAGPS